LRRWREQCLEWCHARSEGGRFGDQGYLDSWPGSVAGIHVFSHAGVGVGPWNIERVRVSGSGDGVRVDGVPLVFFHFHGFRIHEEGGVTFVSDPVYGLSHAVRSLVYEPYVAALALARERVAAVDPSFKAGFQPRVPDASWARRTYRRARSDLRGWWTHF